MPYIFCFAGVKFSQFPISFFYGMLIMFVIQTIIAPQTNRLITNSVSKRFEDWKYDLLSKVCDKKITKETIEEVELAINYNIVENQ